ncbi:MAG: glycosyltransferase family 39 protein [Planctomycetes bacterium]|nr:glycosyltransferase family 39 protein [Planctomycetota bacterium]
MWQSAIKFLVFAGLVLRAVALPLNALPHGDVHLDLLTLSSLWQGHGLRTPLERSVELYPPSDAAGGYPLDQHPPLALLLAAPLRLVTSNPYTALRLASLFEGALLVLLAFLLGRRLHDAQAGWVAAALVSCSFLLVDFSGNGSIYTLHALLGLVVLLLLTCDGLLGRLLCGAALGLASLANHQALVFLPTVLLALVLSLRRDLLSARGLASAGALLSGFVLAVLPWWLRNQEVFGDPVFSVNTMYARWRLGGAVSIEAFSGTALLQVASPAPADLAKGLAKSLIANTRFIVLQAPLWAGPVLAAALLGGARLLLDGLRRRSCVSLALVLLPLFHVCSMAAWPATKFRYFVPLLPLLVLLALSPLRKAPRRSERLATWAVLAGMALVAVEMLLRGRPQDGVVLLLALALLALPVLAATRSGILAPGWLVLPFLAVQLLLACVSGTGTTYYDGILASDLFGAKGEEAADRARQQRLKEAAADLALAGVSSILAPIELKTYALEAGWDVKVVQPVPRPERRAAGSISDREAVTLALHRHGVSHALAETREEADFYRSLPFCAGEEYRQEGPAPEPLVLIRLAP